MTDILNDITDMTVLLITDSSGEYVQLGIQCLLFGFVSYSLLSLFSYGIIQAIRLFNINNG